MACCRRSSLDAHDSRQSPSVGLSSRFRTCRPVGGHRPCFVVQDEARHGWQLGGLIKPAALCRESAAPSGPWSGGPGSRRAAADRGPRPWRPRRRRATWYPTHPASAFASPLPSPPFLPPSRRRVPLAPRCTPWSAAHAQRVLRVLALTPPTSWRGQMKKSPGMLKMWQRRWFVLDGGVVTYYKNHAEVSASLCPSSRRYRVALPPRVGLCAGGDPLLETDQGGGHR